MRGDKITDSRVSVCSPGIRASQDKSGYLSARGRVTSGERKNGRYRPVRTLMKHVAVTPQRPPPPLPSRPRPS